MYRESVCERQHRTVGEPERRKSSIYGYIMVLSVFSSTITVRSYWLFRALPHEIARNLKQTFGGSTDSSIVTSCANICHYMSKMIEKKDWLVVLAIE